LEEVRSFGATVPELLVLRDWLVSLGVTHVAMESTGVYWKQCRLVRLGSCLPVSARSDRRVSLLPRSEGRPNSGHEMKDMRLIALPCWERVKRGRPGHEVVGASSVRKLSELSGVSVRVNRRSDDVSTLLSGICRAMFPTSCSSEGS
jgi:hypothetical protein